jgi:ribosomal protein S27AE
MHHRLNCGKCGSSDLLQVPATHAAHSQITVGDRLLHTVDVQKYVCTDCGCVEEWVNSKADLARLKAEYLRGAVGP